MAAIFAPVFKRAKERFKEILKDFITYADGYTPLELNDKLKTVGKIEGFFSNDLSKQDR